MAEALRFEFVTPIDLPALEALWRSLQARADHSFFLDWNWVGTWLREVGGAAGALVGRVAASGEVVLLGALMPNTRRGLLHLPVEGLHLHDTGRDEIDVITIEYNGFLVDAAWRGRAEAAAIRFLLQPAGVGGRRRDELHMTGITEPFRPSGLGDDLACEMMARRPSWQVPLDALRRDRRSYLSGLSANTRYQIRRSIRLYERRGPLVTERARDVAEGIAFLEALKRLHQGYWTRRGETGSFAFPFFERFQRRLIEVCLPTGEVELLRISAGGEEIGYLYNFVHDGRVLSYQSGFHYESDPRLKPGLVSHTLCIGRHLAEGAHCYDFLAGDARYKASLGEIGPTMTYWRIERPTPLLRVEKALLGLIGRLRGPAASEI